MPTTYHLIKDRILSKGTLFHHVFTLQFEYELTKKKSNGFISARTSRGQPRK